MKRLKMDSFGLRPNQYAVLAAVAAGRGRAYGVSIRTLIKEEIGVDLSFGRIYPILAYFIERGWVEAEWGEKTEKRGGKPKKYYTITAEGEAVLESERSRVEALATLRPAWAGA